MADMMTFPNTVEEFMEQCKITDTEQVYTNGAELVPIFRMKQWFDHEPERKKDEWTPIIESPPEEEGRYLVTDDAGGVKTVQDDKFLYREDGTPLWLYSQNVTAWKPLPEPYRGEQDE